MSFSMIALFVFLALIVIICIVSYIKIRFAQRRRSLEMARGTCLISLAMICFIVGAIVTIILALLLLFLE